VRAVASQFLVFVTVGVFSALLDIIIMKLLLLAKFNFLVATTVAFALNIIVNFTFHVKFTFSSSFAYGNFWRYLVLVAINYCITVVIVATFEHLMRAPMIGKLVSLPVIAIIGFVLSRAWVFRRQ
jgi:putative flippase GtrA